MQTLEYASFWQRLTAFMLDMFIIILPTFSVIMSFTALASFDFAAVEAATNKDFEILYQLNKNLVFILLIAFASISFLLALFTISRWQATPGKRIVNIYIAARDGSKLRLKDAFGRSMCLPLFVLMIQIFQRRENYAIMENLKSTGKNITDMATLTPYLDSPVAHATTTILFATLILWFFNIFLNPERAAIHDILFNSRVFKGKKS